MTPPLSARVRAAAELEGLAWWFEDELAGGAPPKYLVKIAVLAIRLIAARLKIGGGRRW